jgi:hypothetical protein
MTACTDAAIRRSKCGRCRPDGPIFSAREIFQMGDRSQEWIVMLHRQNVKIGRSVRDTSQTALLISSKLCEREGSTTPHAVNLEQRWGEGRQNYFKMIDPTPTAKIADALTAHLKDVAQQVQASKIPGLTSGKAEVRGLDHRQPHEYSDRRQRPVVAGRRIRGQYTMRMSREPLA